MVHRVRMLAFLTAVAAAVGAASLARGAEPVDHAAASRSVLPPGQAGGLVATPGSTDQLRPYDGLTPLQDRVTPAAVAAGFKPAPLGLGGERAVTTERPRAGVVVRRDRWGVPHVVGVRDVDVAFGAGWATAQDRQVVMELVRGPARLAALDVPGTDPLDLVLTGRTFVPSPAAEERLEAQVSLLLRSGDKGRRAVRLIDAYLAGINGWYRKARVAAAPWTRADVVAVASLFATLFGTGGGDEAARADFLARLQKALGGEVGRQVWEDLRLRDDPEARTAVETPFPYGRGTSELGNVVLDADSLTVVGSSAPAPAARPPAAMSNALLVGSKRSATGRPLAVMGPQVAYTYPGLLLELDLRGGGYAARGASFPGISFAVLVGRGPDYAWSATSARGDLVDQYVETLCDGSEAKYVFQGECRVMAAFEAGVVRGPGGAVERPVTLLETVHGPVSGYATVEGRRVAISSRRSTRGRELLASRFFVDLSTGVARSARDFTRLAGTVELSFNWHYVDDRDIAVFTSGRLPLRPPSVDSGLPTKGTGEYEWQGFLPAARHPQQVNPKAGVILNWNNKPARGMVAADDEWSDGSVQRVDLLWAAIQRTRRHTLATLVGAMNVAATQDLRVVRVWPSIRAVLAEAPAPTERARRAVQLVDGWQARGGTRLDANLDGAIDAPGAAVLDAAWAPLGDAVLRPVLGDLVADLARLVPRDDAPGSRGSAYGSGWYTYLDKDLRALLGRTVRGPFRSRFCGKGVVATCAAALWAAIDQAAERLETTQGPDPAGWRADATKERIAFAPGLLTRTMRWTNRPTFQQVVSFRTHRARLPS